MRKDLTIKANRSFLKVSSLSNFTKVQKIIYEYLLCQLNENTLKYKNKEIKKEDLEKIRKVSYNFFDFREQYNRYAKKKLNSNQLLENCADLIDKKITLNGFINGKRFVGQYNIFEKSLFVFNETDESGNHYLGFTETFINDFIKVLDKNGWQKYQWKRIVQIDNTNGIDLYKFFKSHEYEGIHNKDRIYKYTFSIEELYYMFLEKTNLGKIKEKSYLKDRNAFEKRFLDPACVSFNNSDLKLFDYKNKNKRGKEELKFYKRTKEGYTFVCKYDDSDYFKYGMRRKIVKGKESIEILNENQNKYNSNHRINTTMRNEEKFFDNDFYNDWEKENQKRIGQELFSHGFFK